MASPQWGKGEVCSKHTKNRLFKPIKGIFAVTMIKIEKGREYSST
jgi:hypothetical protein